MVPYFDRYILREVTPPFLLGLLLYSFVLLMNQILVLTEQIVTRGVGLGVTFRLLACLLPSILAFTMPMAVLMGILAGLSRLSSDSEVVAFRTLGIGQARLMRPLLAFALIGWLLTSFLTLFLAPRSNALYVQTYVRGVLHRVQFRVTPRVFNESISNTVIYVQDLTGGEEDWRNILMSINDPSQEPRLILARAGRLDVQLGTKKATLQLLDGADHSYPLEAPEKYRITFFEKLKEDLPVGNFLSTLTYEPTAREKDIRELFREEAPLRRLVRNLQADEEAGRLDAVGRANLAHRVREHRTYLIEIHKRFALPVACLVFVFLGLPLGVTTRKGGRTSGFTISIGIILAYYILITAGEQLARDGKIFPWLGMWGPNIIFTIFSLWLFLRSNRDQPFLFRLRSFLKRPERAPRPFLQPAPSSRRGRGWSGFPRLLDRYIMRKYLVLFGMIFGGLLAVVLVITFFERINTLYDHGKPASMLLQFIWFTIPDYTNYILPVAALTAMLLTLGLLTKFNEITAMKACGISLYRAVAPVVLLAVLVSLFSFYLQEKVLPVSNKKANRVWDAINDLPPRSYNPLDRTWLVNRAKDRFFHYLYFDPAQSAFRQLTILDVDPRGWRLTRRLYAQKAVLDGQSLTLTDGWLRLFNENVPVPYERFERMSLSLAENRDFFLKEWKEPSQMNLGELRSYIREVKELGFDTVRFRVDWHGKLALPLVALIMTLIGIPFAFSMGKRGTLVGIAISLVIAMLYWGAIGFFRGLGYAGSLNPFLAVWAPNIIFGLAGVFGLLTLRT